MSPIGKPDRRDFLKDGLSLGALSLATGCDLTDNQPVQRLLWKLSYWNDRVQGWMFNPNRLAPIYPESAVDRVFRYNAFYPEEQAPRLDPATYRLELTGAIGDKRSWTVDNLYRLPQTSQITRHVCVEGWSRIGKWSGCPLQIFLYRFEADPHQEIRRLYLRRRVLHQHRHADGAPPADHHGLHLCRPGAAAQVRLSDEDPDPDKARFPEPEIRRCAVGHE
jgi:DMSO/TMAO reductase YedYZ molybdopterin-dependent catalytic subunit